MTHPPIAPPAPPAPRASSAPPAPPAPVPPAEPPRRRSWAEGAARLRAAARTEPGRLRIIGVVLAGLLLLFGAATFWQVADRYRATDTVLESSQPLSAGAAEIYRLLADANTAAATGFLAGADEDPAVRQRYEEDIANAAGRLADAAADTSESDEAQEYITLLNERLPVYTGLVETARANNRQGLPLGGAYLRYADEQMQQTLLVAAADLYVLETDRFQHDIAEARAWPWLALGAGGAALVVLAWAQRRHYLRTNRLLSPGLIAASAAATVLLLWLTGAHALARDALHEADRGAARSLSSLNGAWTEALRARGDENITLVARGADDASEESFQARLEALLGRDPDRPGGLLADAAERAAGDPAGEAPVERAIEASREWSARHADARELELAGDYDGAVHRVIGGRASTGEMFDRVNDSLADAVAHEQEQFGAAGGRGRDRLDGLAAGALVLTVLGVAGTALGIGRRLSEYR
ncbi:hypothetical protein [Streptomyces sp. NPDC127098]|uniref:hypothetical protein n=1 Tax=Streptomyces sp. NPDC127098 TaxID=3347137 RepID=UPI00364DA5E1